jgi:hypothetical protein
MTEHPASRKMMVFSVILRYISPSLMEIRPVRGEGEKNSGNEGKESKGGGIKHRGMARKGTLDLLCEQIFNVFGLFTNRNSNRIQ